MDEHMVDKKRIVETLEWMVKTLRHQFDQETGHTPSMGSNQYSPEMTEAIALLADLKRG